MQKVKIGELKRHEFISIDEKGKKFISTDDNEKNERMVREKKLRNREKEEQERKTEKIRQKKRGE